MSNAISPDITAKQTEIAALVMTFEDHFHIAVDDTTVDSWYAEFGHIASPILGRARNSYLEHGLGFPDLATFQQYIDVDIQTTSMQRPGGGPCGCDGGWLPAPPVMRGRYRYDNQYRQCTACLRTAASTPGEEPTAYETAERRRRSRAASAPKANKALNLGGVAAARAALTSTEPGDAA